MPKYQIYCENCEGHFFCHLCRETLIFASFHTDCGALFIDQHHAYPLSYDGSRYRANQVVHCVWYFDFSEEIEMNILVSLFTLSHGHYSSCRREFLEIRTWNDKGQVTFTKRECKTLDYKLPTNFSSSTSRHFAVTIHSAGSTGNGKQVSALCFPTTTGKKIEFAV